MAVTSLIIEEQYSRDLQYFQLNTPFMITQIDSSDILDEHSIRRFAFNEKVHYRLRKSEVMEIRPQHKHSFIEIMFVLSGAVVNHIEHNSFVYHSGQGCIMNRNIQHCEEFEGDYQAVFFMLHDDFLKELLEDCRREQMINHRQPTLNAVYQFLEDEKNGIHRFDKIYMDLIPRSEDNEVHERLGLLYQSILKETDSLSSGFYPLLRGYFSRFLEIFCDPSLFSQQLVNSETDHQMFLCQKMLQLIEATNGRCSRTDLEDHLHYNAEYLNRILKQQTRRTIKDHCQSAILARACSLLTETDKTIEDIVMDCGLSNRTYFYRLFEKYYGETPKSYRERARRQ